jgi:uncharacterized repeat protein (TIGR01451 family)
MSPRGHRTSLRNAITLRRALLGGLAVALVAAVPATATTGDDECIIDPQIQTCVVDQEQPAAGPENPKDDTKGGKDDTKGGKDDTKGGKDDTKGGKDTPPPIVFIPPPIASVPHPVVSPKAVIPPRLTIVKRGSDLVRAGSKTTWTIQVTNTSGGRAKGVVVSDWIPNGFIVVSSAYRAAGEDGQVWRSLSHQIKDGRAVWAPRNIGPHQNLVVRVTMRALADARGCMVNRAFAQAANHKRIAAEAEICIPRRLLRILPAVTG